MLFKRIFSAIIGILLFVFFLFLGDFPFFVFILLITMLGVNELINIIYNKQKSNIDKIKIKILLSFSSLIIILNTYFYSTGQYNSGQSFLVYIPLIIIIFLSKIQTGYNNIIKKIGADLFILVYFAGGMSFFILLANYNKAPLTGSRALWLALIVTWCTDSGAYFIGNKYGQKKLAPKISPNKSWEGAIGGTFTAALASVIISLILNVFSYHWIFYGMTLALLAIFGDLFASCIKRDNKIKDSGKIIPGHGGILDRFDSLIFTLPFTYMYLFIYF